MTVVTLRTSLTETDVHALTRAAAEDERAAATVKLCRRIDYAELSPTERAHAEEILRILAEDTALMVRAALSVTLQNSPKLPRDVAMKLARDVDKIAIPILKNSPVLTDADLVELLRSEGALKRQAIAGREALSEAVVAAIIEVATADIAERTLRNDRADFTAQSLTRALDRFPEDERITAAMVRRKVLPVAVVEKLVAIAAGDVFDHLVNNHALPPQIAIDLASATRERAAIDLVEQAALQTDLAKFTHQLNLNGRLTPALIMRAMCLGQMAFVENALAELSGLSHHRAWLMIHDNGPLGLKTLFERGGLPPRLFPAFRAAVDVYHQLEREGFSGDRERMRVRMIERALTLFQSIPREELDYLLEKLDAPPQAARAAQ